VIDSVVGYRRGARFAGRRVPGFRLIGEYARQAGDDKRSNDRSAGDDLGPDADRRAALVMVEKDGQSRRA
jgi:hypothetical protein